MFLSKGAGNEWQAPTKGLGTEPLKLLIATRLDCKKIPFLSINVRLIVDRIRFLSYNIRR